MLLGAFIGLLGATLAVAFIGLFIATRTDQLVAVPGGVQIHINASGDTTGATDTMAIAAALEQCDGTNVNTVVLHGQFYIKVPPGLAAPANCAMWSESDSVFRVGRR